MDKLKNAPFLFSVVMAIYNVEKYLEEAIESVVNQSLSFTQNVQLILVNDGSPDNSEEICLRYMGKYPENIFYVKQENGGVSVARNTGISIAQGTYISFLDPDDMYANEVLEKVDHFFKEFPDVYLATISMHFFEARVGLHRLSKKFNKYGVIDINKNFEQIVFHSGASFFHREKALGEKRFIVGKKIGEDATLLTDIILKQGRYGVIPDAVYLYRKRFAGNSALQTSQGNSGDYISVVKRIYNRLKVLKENGNSKYIQSTILYKLHWTLRLEKLPDVMQGKEKKFWSIILDILQLLDQDVIRKHHMLKWYQKHALLSMKEKNKRFNRNDGFYHTEEKDDDLLIVNQSGKTLYKLSEINGEIEICRYKNKKITFIGKIGSLFPTKTMKVFIRLSNKKKFIAKKIAYPYDHSYLAGTIIHEYYGFRFDISKEELQDVDKIFVYVECQGVIKRLRLSFNGRSCQLSNELKNSYMLIDSDYMLSYHHEVLRFDVKKYSYINMQKKERNIENELRKLKVVQYEQLAKKRILYRQMKLNQSKKVNLFIDKIDRAGQNAEVLYEYFEKYGKNLYDNYFVIDANSSDFSRLKEKGFQLLDYQSDEFKLKYLLLASNLISSQCEPFVYQPDPLLDPYIKDLKTFDFIFLQDEVMMQDMSNRYKKFDKNFSIFVTSSKYEYQSIIKGNYQYSEDELKLTGMPIFDKLKTENHKKMILIIPTSKDATIHPFSKELNTSPYNDSFKETLYFQKWNGLLNNEKFMLTSKKLGYTVAFAPPLEIKQQLQDFCLEHVQVLENFAIYDLVNDSSMLITDYSTIAFYFAYSRKSVFYYQDDLNNQDHLESYFSYDRMGFGKILNEENELVEAALLAIERDAKMDDKYEDRVNTFFKFHDQKNCQRIYNAVEKLSDKNESEHLKEPEDLC